MKLDPGSIIDKYKNSVDKIEAIHIENVSMPVEFKNNELFSIEKKYSSGIGIRIVKDGKIGFSSTSDEKNIEKAVFSAIESSEFGENTAFELPDKCNFNNIKIYDNKIIDTPQIKYIEILAEGIDKIINYDSKLNCEAKIDTDSMNIHIINSNGLDIEYKKTGMSMMITALLQEKEGGFQWIWDFDQGTDFITDPGKISDNIIQKVKYSKTIIPFKTESLPVILTSEAMMALYQATMMGTNGKMLQKGISPLSEKLDSKVFSDKLSITDDPFVHGAEASIPFDEEGVECQKTVLIENGILKNFIYDLQTAGIMNTKSTGNGRRSYSALPQPSYTNYSIAPGSRNEKDIIKDIKEGIIVCDTLGSGQSNLMAGDYSVNISLGFYIKNGEIKGRIKNAMIAGNVYSDLLDNVEELSLDRRDVGVISPSVLLKSKKITA